MRRYIDAEDVEKRIDIVMGSEPKAWDKKALKELKMYVVHAVPTADVRENVRGEWITPTEKMYSMDGEDITPAYKECNRCHKVYVRTNDNFCPNCGADMRDGEADDESRIN